MFGPPCDPHKRVLRTEIIDGVQYDAVEASNCNVCDFLVYGCCAVVDRDDIDCTGVAFRKSKKQPRAHRSAGG